IIALPFVRSKDQLADILTKAVNEKNLHECLGKLNYGNPDHLTCPQKPKGDLRLSPYTMGSWVVNNLVVSSEAMCVTEQEIAKPSELLKKGMQRRGSSRSFDHIKTVQFTHPKRKLKNSPDLQIPLCKEMVECVEKSDIGVKQNHNYNMKCNKR
nr:putative ribonuclease H-like domain-containing protein [Tanacetum cinerariifolium]